MCGGFSAAGFFVKRLILPETDTVDAKQLGSHASQTRMTRQCLDVCTGLPQSHALNETLFVGAFVGQRAVVCGSSACHFGVNCASMPAKLLDV